jgi:hypothetical protein
LTRGNGTGDGEPSGAFSWPSGKIDRDDRRRLEQGVMQERKTNTLRKPTLSLYVEKSCQQWVVRDTDGNFWLVPPDDDPWNHRQPYNPNEETELEPVPGHYRHLLGLPI